MESYKKQFTELSPTMQKSLFDFLVFFLTYKKSKSPVERANKLLLKDRSYKQWKNYRYYLAVRVDKKRQEMGMEPIFINK